LTYVEGIINNHLIRYWDKDLADKYEFKFVGLELETKEQEQTRLEKETKIWKTVNEARIEMGFAPMEDGDIILNGAYTQFVQARKQMEQGEQQAGVDGEMPGMPGEEGDAGNAGDLSPELEDINTELDKMMKETDTEVKDEAKAEEKKQAEDKKAQEKTEKSNPTTIEYYYPSKKDED